VEIGGEKDRKEAGVDGSGYDTLSVMLRYIEVFRVLRAGISQSGRGVEILKARRTIISQVGFV